MNQKFNIRHAARFLLLFSFILISSSPLLADEGNAHSQTEKQSKPNLSAKELLKTKAGRLFITRKYVAALDEFKKLAKEYPTDMAIQRYSGICLLKLDREEEAVEVFNDALRVDPNDLASRKYLGVIYLRRGDADKAEEQFNFIKGNAKKGKLSAFAARQLDLIGRLKEEKKAFEASGGAGRIAPDEFLKSKAAQAFIKAKYAEALTEFENLEKQYPQDLVVRRYRGLTLQKLKRTDEAIEAFQAGLKLSETNAPFHYYLAQSLAQKKDYAGARAELKLAVKYDLTGDYKKKANRDLKAIKKIEAAAAKAKKPAKKWSGSLSTGFEVDSNATSEPTKRRRPAEEHATKFPTTFTFNYDLYKEGPWSLKAGYSYSQVFYDGVHFLNLMAHSPNLTLSYTSVLNGRPLTWQFASGFTHVTVHRKYYSASYPQTLTLVYSFADWHRIILSDKINNSLYNNKGARENVTSKQGLSNTATVTNNFYFNKEKNRYLSVIYDFEYDDPQGSNFVKNVHEIKEAYVFPFGDKWEGNLAYKYKHADYPETIAAIKRVDNAHISTASVTFPLADNWKLKVQYEFTFNKSNDPLFNYSNHAGGATVSKTF